VKFRKPTDNSTSMIMLGGWLFADLLLGLAMLFLTSGTSGSPPPTATPTSTPNQLATAEVRAARTATVQAENVAALNATVESASDAAQATEAARATADARLSNMLTATARADATRQAMTSDQQATAAAQATAEAISSEATIAAFATLQAQSDANVDEVTRNLATAAAQATADALSAQATISAQQTEAAQVEAIATQNAESGANALATANAAATQIVEIQAIATQNAESGANDLATAQAQAEAAQATAEALSQSQASSDSDRATAQAEVANIQATVESVKATATIISQRAGLNSIDQGYAEVTIKVDASGLLSGDKDAENAAKKAIQDALKDYDGCRVGITLTYGWDPDINRGLAIADAVNKLLPDAEPEMFKEAAYENFGNLQPAGTVEIRMYFFRGCQALNKD
jgi:chemotaxis protein histidine kinase CheA